MRDPRSPIHQKKPSRTTSERTAPPKLFEAGEVGEILHVSRGTVLAWARAGRIPCRRFGRRVVRFELEKVLEAEDRRARRTGGAR